ncbi:MAG: hypothetical protein EA360_10140 [Balneolaceae bacterium]|nr:MAG: hypothetical protein EA360_10140 [Balneolaceae bacterium]
MDFFEAQDRAKRNTGKLIVLYALAVTGIVLSIYAVTLVAFQSQYAGSEQPSWWQPAWFLTVFAMVGMIIGAGTLYRVSQLRKGGSAVAELLGGRKVEPSSTDPLETRLINIVEEMSLASGLPVPDIYILDREENINAFAAGFGTADAAVGVTRGCLEQLSRDELQGVIAHEFSHIFNGDMRLNIRLIGILNGILVIHVMGMILMRSVMFSGGRRVRTGGNKNEGNAAIAIIAFGLALVIIGWIGMIFGRMIQSAISRQREYLADAAAVQYTRNPDGIAGALKKIGAKKRGAEIADGHAMEMSHLFFASSFHSALDRLYATHPPIEKRIRALNTVPSVSSRSALKADQIRGQKNQKKAASGKEEDGLLSGHKALTPEVILAAIGTMHPAQLEQAGTLLSEIPAELRRAAHEPMGSEAVVLALLAAAQGESSLPAEIRPMAGVELSDEADKLIPLLEGGRREWYLPLAELALPALREMSEEQYSAFRAVAEKAAAKAGTEDLFPFVLEKLVVHQLDRAFGEAKEPEERHSSLRTLRGPLSVLLAAFARLTGSDPDKALQAGLKSVQTELPEEMKFELSSSPDIAGLNSALEEITASSMAVKKEFLRAVITIILFDRQIHAEERELLRGVSEAIGLPVPL